MYTETQLTDDRGVSVAGSLQNSSLLSLIPTGPCLVSWRLLSLVFGYLRRTDLLVVAYFYTDLSYALRLGGTSVFHCVGK